jgi:hypothetical protein
VDPFRSFAGILPIGRLLVLAVERRGDDEQQQQLNRQQYALAFAFSIGCQGLGFLPAGIERGFLQVCIT